jgi:hypothetical protein
VQAERERMLRGAAAHLKGAMLPKGLVQVGQSLLASKGARCCSCLANDVPAAATSCCLSSWCCCSVGSPPMLVGALLHTFACLAHHVFALC